MPREFPEQREPNDRREREFAETSDLSATDRALLESATAEALADPADGAATSLVDDDAVHMDVSTEPTSERELVDDATGAHETDDGLDETDEAVRQQAEDKAPGSREDFTG